MRRIFVAALVLLSAIALTACDLTRGMAGATDAPLRSQSEAAPVDTAFCETWGRSLPTRSRQDTEQTSDEIEAAYDAFAAACPGFTALIPEAV